MRAYLAATGGAARLGKLSTDMPGLKKAQLEPHFRVVREPGDRDFVVSMLLPPPQAPLAGGGADDSKDEQAERPRARAGTRAVPRRPPWANESDDDDTLDQGDPPPLPIVGLPTPAFERVGMAVGLGGCAALSCAAKDICSVKKVVHPRAGSGVAAQCRYFAKGWCCHGDSCRFAHRKGSGAEPAPDSGAASAPERPTAKPRAGVMSFGKGKLLGLLKSFLADGDNLAVFNNQMKAFGWAKTDWNNIPLKVLRWYVEPRADKLERHITQGAVM